MHAECARPAHASGHAVCRNCECRYPAAAGFNVAIVRLYRERILPDAYLLASALPPGHA